jgi:hypothetical protein
MPRRGRCILAGVPCHVTQRGVNRCETFSSDQDRSAYLRLLRENLPDTQTRLLGWCVMTNPVHLAAVPEREDSLAVLLRKPRDGRDVIPGEGRNAFGRPADSEFRGKRPSISRESDQRFHRNVITVFTRFRSGDRLRENSDRERRFDKPGTGRCEPIDF